MLNVTFLLNSYFAWFNIFFRYD